MIQITNISSDAHQELNIILETGEEMLLILDYRPTQEAWFFGIEYGDFKTYGNRLCQHPNLLRRFKNILPFGLSCGVEDLGEPWFIDDFSNQRAFVYVLNQADVETVEAGVFQTL